MGIQLLSPAAANASCKAASASASATTQKQVVKDSIIMTDSTLLEAKPGSVPVLMAEVRYGIVFGELNELFYAKVHKAMLFISILCVSLGAGSLLGLLGKFDPTVVVAWALSLAVLGAVANAAGRAFKFEKREADFKAAKVAFQDLEGRGWSMNQGTLDKEIKKLRKNAPAGGGWLAAYAYNRACRELGHPSFSMPVRGAARIIGSLIAA